ncbi:MAG: hypothetical protein ACFFCD_13820 [Promethearchaeota archaeon]
MVIRKKICLVIVVLLFVPLASSKPTLAMTDSSYYYYYEDLQVNLYRDSVKISASFDSNRLSIPGFDPQIRSLYKMHDLHMYFSTSQYSTDYDDEGSGPTLGMWSEVTYSSIEEDEAKDWADIINHLIEQQFGVEVRIHGNTKESGDRLVISSYNVTTVNYFTVLATFREILPEKSLGALFTDELINKARFSQIHLYLRPKSGSSPYFRSVIEITCVLDAEMIPFIQGKYLFDLNEIMQVDDKIYKYEKSDKSIISIYFHNGKLVEDEITPKPNILSENFYSFTFPEKIKSILYVKTNYTMKQFPCLRATKTLNQYVAEPGDQIVVETMIENTGLDTAYDVNVHIQVPEGGKLESGYTLENSWEKILPGDNVTYSYVIRLPKQRTNTLLKPDQVTYVSTNKSNDQTEEMIYTNEVLVSTRSNAPLLIITKESEKSVVDNASTTIKMIVENVGNEEITDIEVFEDIWYGTLIKTPENSTINGTTLKIALQKLMPGESVTIEYAVAVKNDAISHATLTYEDISIKSNEISLKLDQTLKNELTWTYKLKIEKKAFPSTVMPGQRVFVNVTVTNLGIESTPFFNVIDHISSDINSKDLEWDNLHLGPRESITLSYNFKIPFEYRAEGYTLPPAEIYSNNYREIYGTSNVLYLNQNVLIHPWVTIGIGIALAVVVVELIYMRRKYILVKI